MQKNNEQTKKNNFFSPVFFIHTIIGITLCILLSAIFSLLVHTETLPVSAIEPLSYLCVFLGVLVAGLLTALKYKKPFFSSLLQGLFCLLLFYIIGALIFGRFFSSAPIWQVPLSCFSGGILGAIISAFFSKRRRH